jgi:hypothetical protein
MPLVKNVNTGVTLSVPSHYVGHPVLGKNLVLVTDEIQAAPKKETTKKEQPAPAVKVEVLPELKTNIEENEE